MAITVTVIYPADDEHTPERAWTWEAPGPDVAVLARVQCRP
jgi:hypothetical protein